MRRSLAHGEKCILVCDKTLTGGTVAVQDGRAAPSKRLCRAQLDTKIFSFWTSDFYRGKGLAAPAFNGKRAAADFFENVNSKCEKNIKKYNQASRANSSRHSANTISAVFQPNISRG